MSQHKDELSYVYSHESYKPSLPHQGLPGHHCLDPPLLIQLYDSSFPKSLLCSIRSYGTRQVKMAMVSKL